ncbi:MAG: hypothetical protein IH983_10750 [Planctomycetes bacterium]|nr:hypothetical protein [Planctomycetota bacterium]
MLDALEQVCGESIVDHDVWRVIAETAVRELQLEYEAITAVQGLALVESTGVGGEDESLWSGDGGDALGCVVPQNVLIAVAAILAQLARQPGRDRVRR